MTNSQQYVSAIGGANIDIHGRSNQALRQNDSNPGNVHLSAGGVARNVAENLARLGVDCQLTTAIGDDEHGKILQKLSRDAGIDMQFTQVIQAVATSTYLSVLDDEGDMLVGINDMSIMDHLTVERLQPQLAMLKQSALAVLDCNLPGDTLGWLAESLVAIPVFADTVSAAKAPRLKPHLQAIHTLKTSTIEVEALTGLGAGSQGQLQNIAAQLHSQGVERVFITRGEDGMFFSTKDGRGIRKLSREQQIHNSGGAGDAFLAGLAYSWLQKLPLEDTLQFALAAADITLSDRATSSPALSVAAVNQLLETRRAS
jgi:pseudouridine kinase